MFNKKYLQVNYARTHAHTHTYVYMDTQIYPTEQVLFNSKIIMQQS